MPHLGDELKIYRLGKKMSQMEMADFLDVGYRTYQEMEKTGVIKKHDVLIKVLEKTGISTQFIVDNLHVSSDRPLPFTQKLLEKKNHSGPYMVPLVPVSAQAGYARSYENSDFLKTLEEYPIVPGVDPRGAVWRYFQVEGDSMLDLLNDGDYVLASQVPKEDWPDLKDYYMYVIVTDDLVTIKHAVKRKSGNELVLIPRNEKFNQQAILIENIREIWRYRRHIGWNAAPVKRFEIKI